MRPVPLLPLVGVLALSGLLASVVAGADEPPVPCLDTNGDSVLKIQPAVPDGAAPQQVFGTLTSWDPDTIAIGFHSLLSDENETIRVKSLRFEPAKANPAAQQALPTHESLGKISASYTLADVSIVDGVLKFPGCALRHDEHPLAFDGSVTFSATKVVVEGEVFAVKPPQGGGSSDSTRPKGG